MTESSKRPHGAGVRGADLGRESRLFEGRFGRIFRTLPPADFGADDSASLAALAALGAAMVAENDPVKDGPDAEESGIPAAYTYLGQFIDHDLTFDPASSLQRQNDPDALVNFRSPRFDLDCVYGRGPGDQPYLYEEDGRRFILGRELTGTAANPGARDLPRNQPVNGNRRAIIGDPRNDENVIVSQLQGLFLRFHNRLAEQEPTWSFERVQREVRFHYQWMILHDFLTRIVDHDVLNQVLPHLGKHTNCLEDKPNLEFFRWKKTPYIPLEFSAAAYRFGHSMVRPGYRLNGAIGPHDILPSQDSRPSLVGFREFPDDWAIDWSLFADLEPKDPEDATRTQLAYLIDTSLVHPLGHLPGSIAPPPGNLAQRNLIRGWRMRLPSGQDVARAMGLKPLTDDRILIGKFTDGDADERKSIVEVHPGFAGRCPLWTYVLAETVAAKDAIQTTHGRREIITRRLGPVGGRIVAEVFAGLLLGDSSSYLSQDPGWKPTYVNKRGGFGLREFVLIALGREGTAPGPDPLGPSVRGDR